MPKLYEYMGIIVLFYSNEHEPIHVHGKYQGRESRAELIIRDGVVVDIISHRSEAESLWMERNCTISSCWCGIMPMISCGSG
jgi:hypothetical protein